MRLALALLPLAALVPAAHAFVDTKPLLAWTSHASPLLDPAAHQHAGPAADPRAIAQGLTRDAAALCGLDGVAIVEVQDLDHHTFPAMHSAHPLRTRAVEAPAQLSFGHVDEAPGQSAAEIARAILAACASERKGAWTLAGTEAKAKQVTRISVAADESEDVLAHFTSANPRHLVVVASAPRASQFAKRAAKGDSDLPPGLFHRYQFLTSGLLLAILVVVFLLVPIAYFSTLLLADIQAPVPRRPMEQAKKNQ